MDHEHPTYETEPPPNYVDADPHDLLSKAQGEARALLPNIPHTTLQALLLMLAPAAAKTRWYEGRYNSMLREIKELRADVAKLYAKLRQFEARQ